MTFQDFQKAIKSEDHEGVPVWFMRQAGRYLPEFSEIKQGRSIREMCMDSEAVARITELPVKKLGVDAAIIFHDLLLPLEAMGLHVEYGKDGPYSNTNVTDLLSRGDFIEYSEKNDMYPLSKSIRMFRERNPYVPTIGFAGGPITLASYIISEKKDSDLSLSRKMMISRSEQFRKVLKMLTEMIIQVSKIQIKAGTTAIQIFDSWAGYLSGDMFRDMYSGYLMEIASELSGKATIIYFATGTWHMQKSLETLGFDYLSVDWREDILSYSRSLKESVGIQGNLDPAFTAADWNTVRPHIQRMATGMKWKDNYIFNLGHGVPPYASQEVLKKIVEEVHGIRR